MGKSSRRKRTLIEIETPERRLQSSPSPAKINDQSTGRIKRYRFYIAASVALITFLVYLKSLQNDFTNWDDSIYIVNNPYISTFNIYFIKWAFFDFYAGNWHPLTWMSHALDYSIWGLNPSGHHLTNIILHSLNSSLVSLLVIQLATTRKMSAKNSEAAHEFLSNRTIIITGTVTGLLFGLHPLHVESAAWIAERKDLLCAFFFLLSITTYIYYAAEIKKIGKEKTASLFFSRKYLLAIGFFVLALLSKPMAVTLPFVLLILDWYPLRRIQSTKTFWTAVIEKLPFIILSLISSALTILAQKTEGAMKLMVSFPLPARLLIASESLVSYLGKMLLPFNLSPFYPYPPQGASLLTAESIMAIVLVGGITASCLLIAGKRKIWLSVWGYYVVTLLPVLGIVQVGSQSMADRYTYLPSLGPFLIIGLTAAKVYDKASALKERKTIFNMAILFIASAVMVTISYRTIEQIDIWKNSFALWNYVIERGPSAPLPHNMLGNVYLSRNLTDRAIEQYRRALSLDPNFAEAQNNLGVAYLSKGQLDMAAEQFQTALKLKPDYAEANYNFGMALQYKGQLDEAIEQYRITLGLKPNYIDAHNNLGTAYASQGKTDQAIAEYQAALMLKPDYVNAHFNLGNAYASQGQTDKAIAEYQTVLRLKPDFYEAGRRLDNLISGKR